MLAPGQEHSRRVARGSLPQKPGPQGPAGWLWPRGWHPSRPLGWPGTCCSSRSSMSHREGLSTWNSVLSLREEAQGPPEAPASEGHGSSWTEPRPPQPPLLKPAQSTPGWNVCPSQTAAPRCPLKSLLGGGRGQEGTAEAASSSLTLLAA